MGAANGRPLTDPEGPTAASTTHDSGIGLGGVSGADATDASSSPLRPRRLPDSPLLRRPLGSPPLPRRPPADLPAPRTACSRLRPPLQLPDFCDDTSGAVGADLSAPLPMDPLSVPAPPPPFDMSTAASSLPSLPGHPGLVRARADPAASGPAGRMSPSVYNHKEMFGGDWAGRMSPSVYNHKLLAAVQGRSSPAYHDLGYHTLVARSAAASPRQQPPSPWTELGYPGGAPPPATRCPRDSPRPQLPEPPSSAELIMAFKGKRMHKAAPFDRVSDELILHIFSYLSTNELCYCARVCRRWYFLVWEPQLWTSITLTGETTGADRALRQIVKLLCRDNPGTLCHTVERVELNGCARLTDRGLSLLARRCPELRHLELRGCSQVGDQAVMDIVSHCPNLQHLDLTGCHQVRCLDLSQAGADHRLNLQYLDLTDCHNLTDDSLKVIARHCPQLQHLYMRRCDQLTDAGIRHVPSLCPGLREFSISDCSRVTDFSLRELARLGPTLRYLSVAKCDRVSDAGVAQVARSCYKLRYLNVRGCEAVSDAALELVARCCQRLRALDIGKCDVTDHGLKVLAQRCPNLKKLSVKSCEMISDAGVKFVAYYCRGLQQLNIQDSPVTLEGYRTVKKYCKRCIIEHTNPGFF